MANRQPKAQKNVDYREVNKARHEIAEQARKLALAGRERSPYSVAKQGMFIERLNEYVERQAERGKPLTISGFALAAEIPLRTWEKMRNGEYDTMIEEYKMLNDLPSDLREYTTEDGEVMSLIPWSEIVERCYLLTQEQREEACVIGKAGNVVGNIFLLKSQHGLSDAPEQVVSQKNIQIVADADTALKALEMCK